DSALRSFSQALSMAGAQTDRSLRIALLSLLGNLAYRSQHVENARSYYSDAVKLAQQRNDIPSEQMLQLMIIACDWKITGSKSGGVPTELLKRCSAALATCR